MDLAELVDDLSRRRRASMRPMDRGVGPGAALRSADVATTGMRRLRNAVHEVTPEEVRRIAAEAP